MNKVDLGANVYEQVREVFSIIPQWYFRVYREVIVDQENGEIQALNMLDGRWRTYKLPAPLVEQYAKQAVHDFIHDHFDRGTEIIFI